MAEGPACVGPGGEKEVEEYEELKGARHLILLGHLSFPVLPSYRIQYLLACVFGVSLHCLREGILSVCSTQLTQHLTASLAWSRYFNKKHNQRKSVLSPKASSHLKWILGGSEARECKPVLVRVALETSSCHSQAAGNYPRPTSLLSPFPYVKSGNISIFLIKPPTAELK